jgi:PBP1b-binding outer membrane lipoprotein LpoB
MTKLKLLLLLLLTPFLLVGCSSTYNPNIEADEAMPQMEDDSSTSESNY